MDELISCEAAIVGEENAEIKRAIAYFEGMIRETDETIDDYSPLLQEELLEQKWNFIVALDALREKLQKGA